MPWIVVFVLLLLCILQAMRSLSGTRLLVAGLLGIGLLWPVTKWVFTAEAVRQAARVIRQTDAPHTIVLDPSLACRVWQKIDKHEKSGFVRDRIRQSCDKEFFE